VQPSAFDSFFSHLSRDHSLFHSPPEHPRFFRKSAPLTFRLALSFCSSFPFLVQRPSFLEMPILPFIHYAHGLSEFHSLFSSPKDTPHFLCSPTYRVSLNSPRSRPPIRRLTFPPPPPPPPFSQQVFPRLLPLMGTCSSSFFFSFSFPMAMLGILIFVLLWIFHSPFTDA